MLKRMGQYSIEWMMETQITDISLPRIGVSQQGEDKTIEDVDFLVVAAGRKPVRELEDIGKAQGCKVLVLGDACSVGTALDAIYHSVEPALHIFD